MKQAFGIGALEEEEADDDVYTRDDMSRYDFVMGGSDRDQLHGWTAPQHRGNIFSQTTLTLPEKRCKHAYNAHFYAETCARSNRVLVVTEISSIVVNERLLV